MKTKLQKKSVGVALLFPIALSYQLLTSANAMVANSLDKIQISTVAISEDNTSSTPATHIFFSTDSINQHCNLDGGSTRKPCFCEFHWEEINPYAKQDSEKRSPLPIQRTVKTPVYQIEGQHFSCLAPKVYSTEIFDYNQIQIQVRPRRDNPDAHLFVVAPYTYTKSGPAISGSFQDSFGNMFDNVMHYSCYEKNKRGMQISNKTITSFNPQTGETVRAILGNQFCLQNQTGTGESSTDCSTIPPSDFSAQSNYYNLYIRSSEVGDINAFNDNFVCPFVNERLPSNNEIGSSSRPWPLDSSFALGMSPSRDFSVEVLANTKLASNSYPDYSRPTCYSSLPNSPRNARTQGKFMGLSESCLGFAAPLNSQGKCPYFKTASGEIQPTFRLRRYRALYPKTYDTSGYEIPGRLQASDTIYVLDRPVKNSADPLHPYTMLGPKPCPFAYFDHSGAASLPLVSHQWPREKSLPAYVSSSDPKWLGKNIDGIELPNLDSPSGSSTLTCSASIPVFDTQRNTWSVSTVNLFNTPSTDSSISDSEGPVGLQHRYIRPFQPFLPHYEEDTGFQACAPQASPFRDPPLHFSRDEETGRVAWCAESYPTQNTAIQKLDPVLSPGSNIPSGNISPYTSHVAKNSKSIPCSASLFTVPNNSSYNYDLASGPQYAHHFDKTPWEENSNASLTCDRTVNSAGLQWSYFPLTAPANAVENSINQDSSYMCLVASDNPGAKAGVTTPSSGCCSPSSVFVSTGNAGASTAHLEPDTLCGIPSY